ncbi:hypothetical protein [Colwellia sp. 75C3]|uniref:hypothetical protein n=1 Tax=Colwellia sp. 75C3 TaxID=888425 RepID=UPI001E35CF36|nr:hypothetical protein [Colwellia sp. 75C3]
MKFTLLKKVVATVLLSVSSLANIANAGLIIDTEGQLIGATDILIDNELYNVSFIDGKCAEIFTDCDDVDDFLWSNIDQAYDAANALLDQVFIDTVLGSFDISPELIFGCDSEVVCEVYTVFTDLSEIKVIPRRNDTSVRYMRQHTIFLLYAVNTREHEDLVFAKWSKRLKYLNQPHLLFLQ